MADRASALRGLGRVYRPTYRDPKTAKQKNGAVWWIEFWRDGHQHRESSKSRNVSDARKLLKQRLTFQKHQHAATAKIVTLR
jgi:hypothetical protein